MPVPRNPFKHIGEYSWAVLHQWKALIGGAVFSLITWVLSQTPWAGWACLIFFVCFVAPFLAWRVEYEKRLEEEARNKLPRFKGEVKAATNPTGYALDAQKKGKFGTDVSVFLQVRNESAEESMIEEVVITVPEKSGAIHKRDFRQSTPCKRGSPVTLHFLMPLESVRASDLNLDAVKARITDGHNEDHTISVLHPGSESETSKMGLNEADIQGDIYLTVESGKMRGTPSVLGSVFHYQCDCVNRGRAPCEISQIRFVISSPDFPPLPITVKFAGVTVAPACKFDRDSRYEAAFISPELLDSCVIAAYLLDSLDTEYLKTDTIRLRLPQTPTVVSEGEP